MTAGKTKTGRQKPGTRSARSRRRSQRSSLPMVLGISGAVILVVLAILFLVNKNGNGGGEITGLNVYSNLERGHTNGTVVYAQTPPVGGQHNPVWLNCGVYTSPVPNENAVHSLEHGAVWITYRPDLPAEELKALQDLTRQSSYRLLSPYDGLPSPIVASAWGYQLQLDRADDPRLMQFIQKYEQNPFGPEPGASCSGGTGTPG